MKRILFAAAFILTGTLTFAQVPVPQSQQDSSPQQKHVANPHKAAMRLSRELGLSPDQESKLEPILADRRQKIAADRANASLTDMQRKQQLKEIHQSSKLQLSGVLSPDQMKQMRTIHRDHEAAKTPTGV